MLKQLVAFILILSINQVAHADMIWGSLGASYSKFTDVSPSTADDLKRGSSYFAEIDIADIHVLSFHYAYRYNLAHGFEPSLRGRPQSEATFNYSLHEIGLRLNIPTPHFDVYAGAGGLWGRLKLEDEVLGYGADKKGIYGRYMQAGINIYFNELVGIKLAYQVNHLRTEELKNLNDKRLKFDQGLYSVGIVFRGLK